MIQQGITTALYNRFRKHMQTCVTMQNNHDIYNQQIPILFDSSNNLHRDIRYHPEQPSRIQKCVEAMWKQYNLGLIQPCPVSFMDVATIPCPEFFSSWMIENKETNPNHSHPPLIQHEPFTDMELDYARAILVQTHSQEYVSNLEITCKRAKQRRIDEGKDPLGFSGYIDADTFLTTESYDVCLRATATWIRCVNKTCLRRSTTSTPISKAAFALTRPPGHHATKTESNGFCLFNFAAAAAIHAIQSGLATKVSIFDWDVHYGQGVADIIQQDPNIRYVSIHQSPAFPYQGTRRKVLGQHRNILTIPLPPDSSWSCGYQMALEEYALPFIINHSYSNKNEEDDEWDKMTWIPDLVIVCAGYDALVSDELASCNLNASDYGSMTRMLREKLGNDIGIVIGLEGGYQLDDEVPGGNLPIAVLHTIHELVSR